MSSGWPRRQPSNPGTRERLYELLPAYLRFRDQGEEVGAALQALMGVLESVYEELDQDIRGLYDDWFIESCQEWIAPLLGQLVGVRGLDDPRAWVPTQRSRIANTLTYRRHKGTLAVLERIAHDVTGWPCVAVPLRSRLATTQALEHLRPATRSVDVRDRRALAWAEGPFSHLARRPQISGGDGLAPVTVPREGHDLATVGLYFWRLGCFPIRRRSARRVQPGCYTFHPLGIDQQLFAPPRGRGEVGARASERSVPAPISRRRLREELEALRAGESPATDYLGPLAAFEILDADGGPISWRSFVVADLSGWQRPAAPTPTTASSRQPTSLVAIDPELGRIAFAEGHPSNSDLRVSYGQVSARDLGGGPYDRARADLPLRGQLPAGVSSEEAPQDFGAIQAALDAWPEDQAAAVIEITDNATYGGWAGLDLEIRLAPGRTLVLTAAPGATPCFIGNLKVLVEPGSRPAKLVLDGILLGGRVTVVSANPTSRADHQLDLVLRHCSLRPIGPPAPASAASALGPGADPSVAWSGGNGERWDLKLQIECSVVGGIALPAGRGEVKITDSIVDGTSGWAMSGDGTGSGGCSLSMTRTTALGRIHVSKLSALDTIFAAPVTATARNLGGVRYSYLAPESVTPNRERCIPDGGPGPADAGPCFMSRVFGHPGFARLSHRTPAAIRSGASNGGEMGAFALSGESFRASNLESVLDEYLPWGLKPRIFHVT